MLVAALVIISLFFSGVSSADGVCETGCRNLVLPSTECSTAFNPLLIMFQNGITRALNPDTVDCNRDTAARFLEQLCTRECFSTFPPFYTCVIVNVLGTTVNVTDVFQTYCSRHADGTFCPLKILEESTGTSPVPLCTPGLTGLPNACNSTCQESYRRLSSRLGCCGGTWFANPSPLSSFERFFSSCNVTLEEQCAPASGAGVLYLSMLLVVAASLLSTIIV